MKLHLMLRHVAPIALILAAAGCIAPKSHSAAPPSTADALSQKGGPERTTPTLPDLTGMTVANVIATYEDGMGACVMISDEGGALYRPQNSDAARIVLMNHSYTPYDPKTPTTTGPGYLVAVVVNSRPTASLSPVEVGYVPDYSRGRPALREIGVEHDFWAASGVIFMIATAADRILHTPKVAERTMLIRTITPTYQEPDAGRSVSLGGFVAIAPYAIFASLHRDH